MKPAVYVQPDEIATTFRVVIRTAEHAKRKGKAAILDQLEKSAVEEPVQQARDPAIHDSIFGLKHHVVLGPTNLRIWN